MRIAFIINIFPRISQTFVLNQITGLLDLGHDIHIFAFNAQDQKIHNDVITYNLLNRTTYLRKPSTNKIERIVKSIQWIARNGHSYPQSIMHGLNPLHYGRKALNLTMLNDTISLIENGPYDVVHSHFANAGRIMATMIPYIPHKAFITSFYGHDVTRDSQINKGINKHLIKRGDGFLPLSRSMGNQLIKLGFPEDRIIRHSIGVQPDKFTFTKRRYSNGRPIHLLTIARLVEKKGVEYALKAAAKVLKENKVKISYRIIGDGPLKEKLEALTGELGLSEYVEFIGWKDRNEVIQLLQWADILILPSVTASDGDQEGTPVSLMEAQAMGLPVLSTLHSGIPEIVEHGKSGYLVQERDVEALAERLKHLITHPEEWPHLGKEGRRIIKERHNVSLLNKRLVEIYKQLAYANALRN